MSRVERSLRMMQNMERLATRLYHAHTGAFREQDMAGKLRGAAANEQQHADDLAACLERLLGHNPLAALYLSRSYYRRLRSRDLAPGLAAESAPEEAELTRSDATNRSPRRR